MIAHTSEPRLAVDEKQRQPRDYLWIQENSNLLIEKGVITDAKFKQKLLEERAVYQRILHPTTQ